MFIKVTYDEDFDTLWMYLRAKYGKEIFDMDGVGKQLDMNGFSKEFFTTLTTAADASVDSNANVDGKDIITYNHELPKPFFRMNSYYLLWNRLRKSFDLLTANRLIESQLIGDFYINDFVGIGTPYCFNYSCMDVAMTGLPMITKIHSKAPKYLYSFKSELEQFVAVAANSTLGATGLADLFIVMSYYVDRILETKQDAHFTFASDKDIWKYVEETLVSLIYTLNQPAFRGNQSPFSNVSVYDDKFLESLVPNYIFLDGKTPSIETVKKMQTLYLEVMNRELERTPITFPVTTACFSTDENKNIQDEAFADFIAEQNIKYGFINIYCGPTSTHSSCCRLRSDSKNEYFNSFGSGSTKIGSLGVVTVNLPRLAYKHKGDKAGFLAAVSGTVEDVAKINHAKRLIIQKRIQNGNMPLYALGYMDLKRQYSTYGVNGLNEVCATFGWDILTTEGQDFVVELLDTINAKNDEMQKRFKYPHNCEQTPSENSAIKAANKDRLMGFDHSYPFYSNQFIPLTTKANMLDRIKLQGMFDSHFSGGAICHINVSEKISNPKDIADLIKYCAKQGVVYWAINYNLQYCENKHLSVGRGGSCPVCGGDITDNLTRVVGFLTKVANWAKPRREQDYPNRQFYSGV